MNDEETIEVFETQIKELQAKIDAIKERKEVWTPKEGPWRLSTDLPDANYATAEDALAAAPLRYNQQMLEAYKREFDPVFKPKFDEPHANYYPWYNHHAREWMIDHTWHQEDPQKTYFSWGAVRALVDKLNNGMVVLEIST